MTDHDLSPFQDKKLSEACLIFSDNWILVANYLGLCSNASDACRSRWEIICPSSNLNTLVGCSIYREGEKFCAKYTLDNKQCCQNNNKKDTFSTSHLDDIIISSEPTQSINKMNDNVPNGTTQVCRCFFCVEYLTKLDSTELEL